MTTILNAHSQWPHLYIILLTILGVGKEVDKREGTFLASSLREMLKQMSVCLYIVCVLSVSQKTFHSGCLIKECISDDQSV